MIPESIVLSFVVGLLRKGKWLHFGVVEIKGLSLLLIGSMMQILLFRIADEGGNLFQQLLFNEFYILHLITYVLIFVPLVINPAYKSLYLMALGTLCNFIVIGANGGEMPVKLDGAPSNVVFDLGHTLFHSSTQLGFLGDVISINKPYPFPKIISIGDIFIVVGVFILIQQIMVNENLSRKLMKM